jgi:uncharacterized protein
LSEDSRRCVEGATRFVLRPIASPLPLAFLSFGVGSGLQSGLQLGLVPRGEIPNLSLLFGGVVFPAMLLVGILAFLSQETLGATLLGLISFSWLGTALVNYASFPDTTSAAMGVFSLVPAAVLLLMGTVGVLGKPLLSVVIALASARYGLNGVYELTASGGVQTSSGVVGCAILLASLYGGLALSLEDVQHRTVLPFGRRGEARGYRGRSRRPGRTRREGGQYPQTTIARRVHGASGGMRFVRRFASGGAFSGSGQ